MKLHLVLSVSVILVCLSNCSSSPRVSYSIEPETAANYWKEDVGYVEKEKNRILVRANLNGMGNNVIAFNVVIVNESDSPVIADKADFTLREITAIPAEGEQSLIVGNVEKPAESEDYARKINDRIGSEAACQLFSCGALCVTGTASMVSPPKTKRERREHERDMDRISEEMDERSEKMDAMRQQVAAMENSVLKKTTLSTDEEKSGMLYFMFPGYREAMAAQKEKKLEWEKQKALDPNLKTNPPNVENVQFPDKPVSYLELIYGEGDAAISFYYTVKSH
ncbi:MAG: hypothetical protein JW969_11790 [Spirochaetales bacterium]|nr:hypothetical protein [Spirochaetales bacterium]